MNVKRVFLGVGVFVVVVVGVMITLFSFLPAVGVIGEVDLEIVGDEGQTVWDEDARLATVRVARGNDSIELVGFNLIFSVGREEIRHFIDGDLDAGSFGIYHVDLSRHDGNLREVGLAPVFVDGEEGRIVSRLRIVDIEIRGSS